MKIQVNTRLYTEKHTGIQNYIHNIFPHIQDLDKDNEYIFLQTKPEPRVGPVKVIPTPGSSMTSAFLFDVFFSQRGIQKGIFHGISFILPFFKKKNIKYVLTVYDLSFLIFKRNHSFIFNTYYRIALWWSLRNADKVIAISECTKNDIIRFYGTDPSKIELVYLDGDTELLELEKNAERIIPEKYFFAVSTHPKRKNIISVIEAISRSKKLQEYTFVLAGKIDTVQLGELNALINKLGLKNIKLLGYVTKEDLASLYRYAEFFIYPSFYEGFGIPVVDALKLHCPVITSNTSCLPEVVPQDYRFLVDPYSIEDIQTKMENMLALSLIERTHVVESNYLFAQKFSWKESAKRTIAIYNSI